MLKNILLYTGYALISSFGLYKIKLSNMLLNGDLILGGLCYAAGFFLLGESFNGSKIAGTVFIIIGIVMIFKISN